jgi:hypothetical protein
VGHTVRENACGGGLAGVRAISFVRPSQEPIKQESPITIFDLMGECQLW